MKTRLTLLFLCIPLVVLADEWPADLAREGECAVCAMRGADHGTEDFVDWRAFRDESFGFCSEPCAEAFDQMPSGYAPPILPREAPAFAWTTLDGASVAPTGQRALLVDFWATWCTPCLKSMPALDALHGEYADRGFRVVGVSIDEEADAIEKFLDRRPVSYPIVHDVGEDPAWWQFRVPAIPAAYLVDGEGRVVAQWNASIDTDEVRREVEALLGSE